MSNIERGGIPEEARDFEASKEIKAKEPKTHKVKNFFKRIGTKFGVGAMAVGSFGATEQAKALDFDKIMAGADKTASVGERIAGGVVQVKDANTRRVDVVLGRKNEGEQIKNDRAKIDADERNRTADTLERGGLGNIDTATEKDSQGRTTTVKVSTNRDAITKTPYERMEENRTTSEEIRERNRQRSEKELQESRQTHDQTMKNKENKQERKMKKLEVQSQREARVKKQLEIAKQQGIIKE